ncbi:hypothetical protein SCHPADRAFT_906861 [Schizopora paradoxa]|uniref:F-box domain-containing protein n=1 Tax=Schizopora paradoxa TaxID=27342 RepID=A0A0H2RF60_9AGAM|nr:hypothetical protein SCHPADRAFT_906861 [Schizopora paradoxa]
MASHHALAVPEILTEIFNFTVEKTDPAELYRWHLPRTPHLEDPPWPFLFVSKFWRAVALTTPSLWSTFIAVIDQNPKYEDIAHLPYMLESHLRLSMNEPLTLVISWTSSSKPHSLDTGIHADPVLALSLLVQKALEKRDRWRDVEIFVHVLSSKGTASPVPINFIFKLADMKALQRFKFRGHAFAGKRLVELSPSPLLESLSIGGSADFILRKVDALSAKDYFPRLRTASLSPTCRQPYRKTWDLLRVMPHVEWLDLKFECTGAVAFTRPRTIIELPNVRNLTISAESYVAGSTLRRLSLPALVRLDLHIVELDEESLDVYADALILHPMTSLSLSITSFDDSIEDILFEDFLESMRRVRHLEVHGPCGGSGRREHAAFVRHLASALQSGTGAGLLPNLASLELRMSHLEFFLDKGHIVTTAFLKGLILVCQRKYPLEFRFSVSYTNSPHISIMEAMRQIDETIHNDSEIQECIVDGFSVTLNGVRVVRKNETTC